MYAMTMTRLDLRYALFVLNRVTVGSGVCSNRAFDESFEQGSDRVRCSTSRIGLALLFECSTRPYPSLSIR